MAVFAIAATVAVGIGSALAVSTPLPLEFTSDGALWGDLATDEGFANDYDTCDLDTFTMSDARLLATDQDDAFDGAGGVVVGGTQAYEAPPGTANAPVDLTGSVLTAPPALVGPLQVGIEYRGMTTMPTMRELVTLTNPGTAPVTTDVALEVNVGSDTNTTLQASSTGDTTSYPTNARWFVTDDAPPITDPPIVQVATGPGSVQTPAVIQDCVSDNEAGAERDATKGESAAVPDTPVTPDAAAGASDPSTPDAPASTEEVAAAGLLDTDYFIYHYNVSIPPGATRYIMVFWTLYATTAEAVAAGPAWNTNPASSSELLAGLPSLLDIVNWTFPVTLDFAG